VEELKAYALVAHLQTELQAQKTAAGQAIAAATESATLPISHSDHAILSSEGQRRKSLIARLRRAKHTTNHLVPAFLARLRKVDVHSYAPMTTSAHTAINAFGRATERQLDKLLGTRKLGGSAATERGAGCDDPHLLG
jgi:hypothetical protein